MAHGLDSPSHSKYMYSHGRDNKLLFWSALEDLSFVSDIAASTNLQIPTILQTLDINALNYCRFSLCDLTKLNSHNKLRGLIAIPNKEDSAFIDIWSLPQCQRIHIGVGYVERDVVPNFDQTVNANNGITMSLHVYVCHISDGVDRLRLLVAHESGALTLYEYSHPVEETSLNGSGWRTSWKMKGHIEAVMAMSVSPDSAFALTVSSEHYIIKYMIDSAKEPPPEPIIFKTQWPGNASIVIRADSKVCAVGGWDGNIRLYSTKTCKPLGTLVYHRTSCQAIAFAQFCQSDDENDQVKQRDIDNIRHWLASGGKDGRIALWKLDDFTKK